MVGLTKLFARCLAGISASATALACPCAAQASPGVAPRTPPAKGASHAVPGVNPVTGAGLSGWHLMQRHGSHKGLDIYIGRGGIKINGKNFTWGVVCTAPNWDAIIYSRGDKVWATVPFKTWSETGFTGLPNGYEIDPPPKNADVRKSEFMGHPAVFKRWEGEPPRLPMMQEAQIGAKKCSYTLVGMDGIETAPQARLLLRKFLELPAIDGMPVLYTGSTETRNPMLVTESLVRETLAPNVFERPPNLKASKHGSQDVFVGRNDLEKINTLGEFMQR